jgi:hypothetical protein
VTVKLNVPGVAVWPLSREIVPNVGSMVRKAGKPVADQA